MFFGGLSKYIRAKPTSASCHHIAYNSIGKSTQNQLFIHLVLISRSYRITFRTIIKSFLAEAQLLRCSLHCKRELMHAILTMVIDERFIEAYENRFEFLCHDGIIRCFFPRILTYSADYPEK